MALMFDMLVTHSGAKISRLSYFCAHRFLYPLHMCMGYSNNLQAGSLTWTWLVWRSQVQQMQLEGSTFAYHDHWMLSTCHYPENLWDEVWRVSPPSLGVQNQCGESVLVGPLYPAVADDMMVHLV